MKTEENEACGYLHFRPLSTGADTKLRTTELRAELRFAPGETYINTKQRRLKINLDAPVFTISHTLGLKNVLGGDYDYNYTEASIYKRFWLNSWGKVDCYVRGGVQWSKVPFPLLSMPATNLSFIIQDQTFQLINNMEFLNDRFVSADISWDLNGKLFNRLPLIKKLKWREYIAVKVLWGDLTDKNNPLLAQNAGDPVLMALPRWLLRHGPQEAIRRDGVRHTQHLQDNPRGVRAPLQLPQPAHGPQARRALHVPHDVLTRRHVTLITPRPCPASRFRSGGSRRAWAFFMTQEW